MGAIARLRPRVNVVGIVPATENMPSGTATKPGDVLVTMIGKTIVFTVDISRAEAAQEAMLAGCDVADSVTKKTTILVVGNQGMRLTRG